MTRFTYLLNAIQKGEPVEALRFEVEHEDYDGFTDATALQHVLNNKVELGITRDDTLGLIVVGNVSIPLDQFGGLTVTLIQKEKLAG